MPRTPLHTLNWSQNHTWYELFSFNQVFVPGDEEAWQAWLEAHDSFAFQGRQGRLNVYKEARPRGGQYWYAYHTNSKRTHKRYLGRTAKVTFARLEEIAEVLTREDRLIPVPPVQGPEQMSPASILLPKLRPPRLPSLCISRERLLARLEEGRQGKLTLVLAPAGSGKTTLVRQWIEARDQNTQVAWLSLDPEDDDPIRFWHYVLTVCEHFEGKPGQEALKLLSTNQSLFPLLVLKQVLTSFLNDAARHVARLLLILDDYHVITSSQIHESLAYLVDHLPPTLHLVILSRSEPALPLARWRARDDLQELHAA
ncbi:MAG TPA: AAA family ATPase, partial [Ktedonobacteraceae bacterium]|nr:AAA family ATPase [Ktedonobacteraceae bacterium]